MPCFQGLLSPLLTVLNNMSMRLSVMEVRMMKGNQVYWVEEAVRQISNAYHEWSVEADKEWIQSVVLRNFKQWVFSAGNCKPTADLWRYFIDTKTKDIYVFICYFTYLYN